MKKTIIFIITIILTQALPAQQSSGAACFFKAGYTSLTSSPTALNKMAPEGFGGFSKNFTVFGMEGYYRSTKAVLIFEGNISAPNSKTSGEEKTDVMFGTAYAKFGWIISEHKNNWIYPSIGAGIAETEISSYNSGTNESLSPKNKFLLNSSFDFALNADFIINKIPDRNYYKSMLVGIRTGYQVSVKNNAWRNCEDDKVTNAPYYGHGGFYITATIGSGFFIRKK